MSDRPRFALVAGESSGDLLGAELIEGLRHRHPEARFAGIGGEAMADAGMTCWFDAHELAVMGIAEVLSRLPRLLSVRRQLLRRVVEFAPDCFIGIDAPDFNLTVERRLKDRGIPTIHYVSPSIWAWRSGRARRIGRSVDRVLTLFPFEPEIYARHGVDARFVGHPLARQFPDQADPEPYRKALGLPEAGRVLAVLPGSRHSEVQRLGPIFAETLARLARPDLHFVAPAATESTGARFRALVEQIAPEAKVTWLRGRSREAMLASDVVLLASGTAALEALLAKRPMVVAYRIAPLTYWLVHALKMMESDHYALPNVLAPEPVVPEILQDALTPERLCRELELLLDDPQARARQTETFGAVHERLKADPELLLDAVDDLLGARS